MRATFRSVGRALWTTTAVLSLGFLVFASSGFELSRTLGLMVTITVLSAATKFSAKQWPSSPPAPC